MVKLGKDICSLPQIPPEFSYVLGSGRAANRWSNWVRLFAASLKFLRNFPTFWALGIGALPGNNPRMLRVIPLPDVPCGAGYCSPCR